ncbi:MAG: sigma-70 family RNA polymerase sigma factor [Vicinamibacterales bacterium]
MEPESPERLLRDWRDGDVEALDRLVPLVYLELKRLARGQLRRDPGAHSVQPTALVHDAYLRLVGARVDWRDRTHFLSVAARVMRRILVEKARARHATKRGGGDVRVTLSDSLAAHQGEPVDILVLDEALDRLHALDGRQARVVELCYFGGLTYSEIGDLLGVSEATIDRDLRHARAWLRRELAPAHWAGR